MESIVGITRVDRVHEAKLRENFAALVGSEPPGDLDACVRGLETHLEKQTPIAQRVQCDVCEGWSDEKLTSCPYCNDEGPQAIVEQAKPAPVSEVQVHEATVIDAAAIEATGVVLEAPKDKKKGGKKDKKTTAEIAESRAPKPMPELPVPSAPIVNVPLAPIVANEKELDAALDRYRKAGEATANSMYLMGVEIAKIHDHLWQQRLEGGKPKYKSWSQFVATELGTMSLAYANRLKAVSVNFTMEQFEKYGATALMAIVASPKEEHARLLNARDAGASTRELQEDVRKIREEKGLPEASESSGESVGGRKQTSKATEAAAAARKARKESAAVSLGLKAESGDVQLFKKPEGETAPHLKAARAMTLEDQPYGKIECINGVTLFLSVIQTPKGLKIHYTTQREEEDEE